MRREPLAALDRLRDLAMPPARIATDGGGAEPGYGLQLVSLTEDETNALAGPDHPGTVNDVLLAALNLTVAAWNADHRVACRRISVLVPANLRPAGWADEMVGNFTVPARVSTGPAARVSQRAVLAAVTAQMTRRKRTGMGTALADALGASPLLALWVKQALAPLLSATVNRIADTAVYTDLGTLAEPMSFGSDGGQATAVHFSMPTHMPCGVSLGAVTAGGRLHLAFRHRHPQFDAAAAARFAACFVSELAALVDDVGCNRSGQV